MGITRRGVLGIAGVGVAGAAAGAGVRGGGVAARGAAPVVVAASSQPRNPVVAENRRTGSTAWRVGAEGTVGVDDARPRVQGYASVTSAAVGESVDFHVATDPAARYRIDVWRMGDYAGAGARWVAGSGWLEGRVPPGVRVDAGTRMVWCAWPVSWTLRVGAEWVSGSYLAVFTTEGGHRAYTPFVVRDDARAADLLVVLPYATYQAYNQWPLDGRTGRSLYYGYGRAPSAGGAADGAVTQQGVGGVISYAMRSRQVSFDRPYAGVGMPLRADLDHDTVQWVERCGYDVVYATSLDLHAGRVDLRRYRGVVFSGHDEYWSQPMREQVEGAVAAGVGAAYLTANNVYWRVRFSPGASGVADRVMTCYKTDPDPGAAAPDATTLWRDLPASAGGGGHGRRAEQGLLGVQYVGIVDGFHPLVVDAAGHWVWAGTGVRAGDRIPLLVGGEADGRMPRMPLPVGEQTLLSASPFPRGGRVLMQQSSVYEAPGGAVVFVAGTFNWPMGLIRPGIADGRVARATGNVLNRIVTGRIGG